MELEKTVTKSELITLLEQLTAALKSGTGTSLEIEGHQIKVSDNLIGEIEYEEEEGEAELEIELKWSKGEKHGGDCDKSGQRRTGSYELFQGKDQLWYFNLRSANHQIILTSNSYQTKESALEGIDSVKQCVKAEQFEQKVSRSQQPYFVLKSKEGGVIGCSQMYRRKAGADKGMRSVQQHAEADVVERKA